MSPQEKRNAIMLANQPRLIEMAQRALREKGMTRSEFVMVCIQVDDPRWRYIVDGLMPNTPESDWQKYRDRGEEPMARGSAFFSLCEVLSEELPDIADVLMEVPQEGLVKAIVLAEGGGTVYDIPASMN